MRVYKDIDLSEYDFAGQAKENAEKFTIKELDEIGEQIAECYPEGIEDTCLNDIFWFEMEWLVELLGLSKQEVIDRFGEYF